MRASLLKKFPILLGAGNFDDSLSLRMVIRLEVGVHFGGRNMAQYQSIVQSVNGLQVDNFQKYSILLDTYFSIVRDIGSGVSKPNDCFGIVIAVSEGMLSLGLEVEAAEIFVDCSRVDDFSSILDVIIDVDGKSLQGIMGKFLDIRDLSEVCLCDIAYIKSYIEVKLAGASSGISFQKDGMKDVGLKLRADAFVLSYYIGFCYYGEYISYFRKSILANREGLKFENEGVLFLNYLRCLGISGAYQDFIDESRYFLGSFNFPQDVRYEAIRGMACISLLGAVGSQDEINQNFYNWAKEMKNVAEQPCFPVRPLGAPYRIGIVSHSVDAGPINPQYIPFLVQGLCENECEVFVYALQFWQKNDNEYPSYVKDLQGLDSYSIAKAIYDDRIDCLIVLDFFGFVDCSYLIYQPAPVMLSLMHPLNSLHGFVDGLLVDQWFIPPELRKDFPDRIYDLPGSAVFVPMSPSAPEPAQPPCLSGSPITFGSFNRFDKLSAETVRRWTRLLMALPESRLILRDSKAEMCNVNRVLAEFKKHGIDDTRLEYSIEYLEMDEFLSSYSQIDIALDPVGFNGGITTVDALWQGVPVLACPGGVITSRISASILGAIGQTDWICRDEEEWLEKVVRLAQSPDELAYWRPRLRPMLAASSVTDPNRAVQGMWSVIERAMREIHSVKTQTR